MMALQIGSKAPDFIQHSTNGEISFHQWSGTSWCVLFSHPKDFTPVCTTELAQVSRLKAEFEKRNCKPIALSVDTVEDHHRWFKDIESTQGIGINFPVLGDDDRKVSNLYQMIHPEANDTLTVRSVFIIDANKTIRAIITYPASTGRNFDEILRVIDSLQLTDNHCVATPVNWKSGDDCVIVPSITDPEELKAKFPQGYTEHTSYLRTTPQPS